MPSHQALVLRRTIRSVMREVAHVREVIVAFGERQGGRLYFRSHLNHDEMEILQDIIGETRG